MTPLQAALAASALLSLAAGQNPAPSQPPVRSPDVLRIGVDLVQIDATVTDERGRHVPDLTIGDFEVFQNGRPQALSAFSYVRTGTPEAGIGAPARRAGPGPTRPLAMNEVRRTIALVVDDLGLSFESTVRVRRMLQRFLDTQMQPGDLIAILRTGAGMGALQQFTSDRRMLQAAVDRVRWNMVGRISSFLDPGAAEKVDRLRDETFTAGTLGAIRYVIRGLSELPGRKSVLLLSDGFRLTDADDSYGRVLAALRAVVDAANRAGVVVYGMDMRGLVATGPTASEAEPSDPRGAEDALRASHDGLWALAQDTGGLFIRNTNDLTGGLARVLDDQRGYYLLGYVPDDSTFGGSKRRFHTLRVRMKRPGLRVRSRSGFFSVPDGPQRAAAPQSRMVAAVTSPFAGGHIRMQLSSFFGHHEKTGAFVTSVMHVDARDLTFTEKSDGSRVAEIEIVAVTFGDNGAIADQSSRRYTFTVSREAHDRVLSSGLVYRMQVPLKRPGPYQLRIALRDAGSDRIGSASRFIDVPDVKKRRLTLSGLVIEGAAPETAAAGDDAGDPQSSVAVRMFRRDSDARYVCSVYNARRGTGGQPQLHVELRLYRDGVEVFRSEPAGALLQADGTGTMVGGLLRFGPEMVPGSYLLELAVTDKLAKKAARATQTIDFEVLGR